MRKEMTKADEEAIEENWQTVWREILERPDGSIDKEQLKLELMDFSDLIDRMATLTSSITGGKMSYPTYPVNSILKVHVETLEEEREQQKEDDKEDGVCSMCDREFEEKK